MSGRMLNDAFLDPDDGQVSTSGEYQVAPESDISNAEIEEMYTILEYEYEQTGQQHIEGNNILIHIR